MKTKPETTIEKVIARLERIALANKDSFQYRIEVETRCAQLRYCFYCIEGIDHFVFSAYGDTIEEAAQEAWNSMTEQMQHSGYRPVE